MSDLIKRLRSWQSPEDIEDAPYLVQGDLFEAAHVLQSFRDRNEIERLRAVVDAVKYHKEIMPEGVMKALAALEDSDER